MKYIITEKTNSLIIFIESEKMKTLCEMADFISIAYPGDVLEVKHNTNTQQGSIILKKNDDLEFINKIKEFIDNYDQ